jgi:CelD/BcsL family acetyltransferase involved in cellulose biosynthesis
MEKRLLGPAATLGLNQAMTQQADRAYVEYNGLLTRSGDETAAAHAALDALSARRDWRALKLAGIAPDSPLLDLPARRKLRTDVSPVYQADLDAVRAVNGDYLSLLSSNTRSQIKRAMKEHANTLPTVAVATPVDAPAWLEEMRALNSGRHADNAWDDPAFGRFVATLVEKGAANNEVELLRFTDANGVVGLLVNFVYRGRAMNYQSAFAAPNGPKDKPGLLCHAAAVARYTARGLTLYSLLAGKDRYKQSLATCEETLEWWTLERFSPRLEAEALARKILRRPAAA